VTSDFSEIAEAVQAIPVSNLVLDGEIVALDESGHASFQLLQNYKQHLADGASSALRYYVFDILNVENRDLKQLPLRTAQGNSRDVAQRGLDPIHFSASFDGDPDVLLKEAEKNRIEGLIAKRVDAPYEPGQPKWFVGENQDLPGTGICHRWLYQAARVAFPFRGAPGGLL